MKKIRIIITAAVFISVIFHFGNAFAEIDAGSFTVSPYGGWYFFDEAQDIYTGSVYGIGVGYNYTERIGVEAVFNFVDSDADPSDEDVKAYIYRVEGLYHLMPRNKFVPFLAAGGGAITLDEDNNGNDTGGMFDYGAGIKFFLNESFAVRGDIRHIIDFDDTNSNVALTLGLMFKFGGREPLSPPPSMDSDGDGIYDGMDECPDTPPDTTVDSAGCPRDSDGDGVYDGMDECPDTPPGVSVDAVGCPRDSDSDGVYDNMDRCPHTPMGVSVDDVGCPRDSDGDGVYDDMDQCPDTLMGIKVDERGCPVPIREKVSIELRVEFEFDRAVIKSLYHDHLQKVANFLETYPETKATIEGHTDSMGTEQYNRRLSQERADSVRKYLLDNYNIPPERLEAIGFGESVPIADNNTEEGRQRNRRVVAVISTVITKYDYK